MAITLDGTNGLNNGDANITNVGDIAVDSISGDADSNTKITFEGSDVISIDTNGSERMRIDSSGNLLMGTTSEQRPTLSRTPRATFYNTSAEGMNTVVSDLSYAGWVHTSLDGGTGTHYIAFFENVVGVNVGQITHNSTSTSYTTSSDYRLKENVVDMTGAITRVKSLSPKRFNFIADTDDTTVDGFLAHEAATVVPEAVHGTKDAVDDEGNPIYQGIDQAKLVPLLTGALQEAIAEIESLKARVDALEAN